MAERDDDERRDENVEAAAAAAGALIGSIAGPGGSVAGAWLGPKLKRWVRGIWAELSESARQRQTDVLFWAIREGVPVDEMEARIKASKKTELLAGLALDAAGRLPGRTRCARWAAPWLRDCWPRTMPRSTLSR